MNSDRNFVYSRFVHSWFVYYRFVALICVIVVATGCDNRVTQASLTFENPDGSRSPILSAEIAQTSSQRSMGLMYRRTLGENNAMLFIFPNEEERAFWMHNTYVELDIIFLDKDLKVVSIQKRATPMTDSSRKSFGKAQYVLEVCGGSSDKWGIVKGSLLNPQSLHSIRF